MSARPPCREKLALAVATEALVSAGVAARRQLTAGSPGGGFHRPRTDRDVLAEVDEILSDGVSDVLRWRGVAR